MITQERAREIMKAAQEMTQYGPWSDNITKAMTPEEDAQVRQHWTALPSSASYMDAFFNFLNGTTGEQG